MLRKIFLVFTMTLLPIVPLSAAGLKDLDLTSAEISIIGDDSFVIRRAYEHDSNSSTEIFWWRGGYLSWRKINTNVYFSNSGDKKLWVVGGDGAFLDIGFQSLSRMIMSGMNINVLVLDTQVYSNTGGQASTASFMAQRADMADHGKELKGKSEHRKELANICLMHPNVYVAQTTCAHINHFYRSIMEANEYDGPSVVIAYSTCQPEHGVADNMAMHQAKLAVDSRAFPLIVYDPRKGNSIKERLDLKGNPSVKEDWYTIRKTGEVIDFTTFARSEGRFSKHFDKEGHPSPELLASKQERLENWHLLQELAGISKDEPTKTVPTQKTSASADAAAKQKAALMAKRKAMKAAAGDAEDNAAKQKAALLAKLKAKKKQK